MNEEQVVQEDSETLVAGDQPTPEPATEAPDLEQDGVTPDSPPESDPIVEKRGDVPYDRFAEQNHELREAQGLVAQYREADLRREAQVQIPPVFGDETDTALDARIDARVDPVRAENERLHVEMTRMKLASEEKDWGKFEGDVAAEYGKLKAAGFRGEGMARLIYDGLRFRDGGVHKQAVESARKRDAAKSKAAGPSGAAVAESEGPDIDDLEVGSAELDQYIEKALMGGF